MKMIEVKNDILTQSPTYHDQQGYGTQGGFIQERNGMWEDEVEGY